MHQTWENGKNPFGNGGHFFFLIWLCQSLYIMVGYDI